jgi:uncharacterized protein YjaG (DUF416 family)
MADRWMPVYEAFSQREDWGDPANLRHSVDAVWAHLRGQLMGPGDQARHLRLLHDSTPHMDDFDAPEALAVAVMVRAAVHSCAPEDSLPVAFQATLSGFEAIVPDWSLDEGIERKLWQRGPVRKELERQLRMIDRIDPITVFDPGTIETLRRELRGPKLAGAIPRRKSSHPARRSAPIRTSSSSIEGLWSWTTGPGGTWRSPAPAPSRWSCFGSQDVVAWARHGPAVWGEEDRRKKKGLAHSAPALGDHLSREVTWPPTDNAEYPWAAEVDGARWQVRLNDFPDEILYSLIVGDTIVGDFHDWPESWLRS